MKTKILIVSLGIIICLLGGYIYHQHQQLKVDADLISMYKSEIGKYTEVHVDEDIDALKKENKALYDSIKSYKDEISFLTQFNYKKVYVTDTIYVKDNFFQTDSINTYTYRNAEKTDSLNYELSIGSLVEPNWYKLNISVADEFTIINRNNNGINQTTIETNNGGDISDVTVINTKKNTFWKRFSFGPTVGVGYGMHNHNIDVMVGVGLTYNIIK